MFTRIGRFFKAVFNAILGEAEGQVPVAMLEESVREMLESLRGLREATATTIAFETRAKRELDAQNVRTKGLQGQAEEALKQGNEKLAVSLSACSWMLPAVLSKTADAPSMLYSSVICCIFFWAAFISCIALSSPSLRIFPSTRSSSTFSLVRALSARSLAAL